MFRNFLIQQNRSQKYFADLLGVSQQAVQHWMSGRSFPANNHISDLAALCDETDEALVAMIYAQKEEWTRIPKILPVRSIVAEQLIQNSPLRVVYEYKLVFQFVDALDFSSFISTELNRKSLCKKMFSLYAFLRTELSCCFFRSVAEDFSLNRPFTDLFPYIQCSARRINRKQVEQNHDELFNLRCDQILDCILSGSANNLYFNVVTKFANEREYQTFLNLMSAFDDEDWISLKRLSQTSIAGQICFGYHTSNRPLLSEEHILLRGQNPENELNMKIISHLLPFARIM